MKKIIQITLLSILFVALLAGCTNPASSESNKSNTRELTSFRFDSLTPPAEGSISGTEITVYLREGLSITDLVAAFSHTGVSVSVGDVLQESGTTPNDFTSPVVYTVTAEDGSVKDYTVQVTFLTKTLLKQMISNGENVTQLDVSGITDMSDLCKNVLTFNQDISGWDVSNVKEMSGMFQGAKVFNQDISGWDVGNVVDMNYMFSAAEEFNQDISAWDVSSVTNMKAMFAGCFSFNQDISDWNVSNVTDMSLMFISASSFNQDISEWSEHVDETIPHFNFSLDTMEGICPLTTANHPYASWDN